MSKDKTQTAKTIAPSAEVVAPVATTENLITPGKVSLKDKMEARKKLDELQANKTEKLNKATEKVAAGKSDSEEPTERSYSWDYPADVKGNADKMKKFRTKYRKEIRDARKKLVKAEKELEALIAGQAKEELINQAKANLEKKQAEVDSVEKVRKDPKSFI